MQPKATQVQYTLSEEENQTIFDEYIKTDIRPNSINLRNRKPFAIFLGGQSGSGKSSLLEYLYLQLKRIEKDTTITVNSDKIREYHPDFGILQETQPNQASVLVNPDTVKWQKKLIDFAISIRYNLILDGTLGGSPEPILQTMYMLREKGYHLRVCLLAVQACKSRFGIYKRYEDQVALRGSGRWVGMEGHDRQYDEIPKTLALLESQKIIDRIQIYARPSSPLAPPLLYDNQLRDKVWDYPPEATKALWDGRNRPWTPDEQAAFSMAVQAVAEQMRQRGVNQADIDTFYRYVEWTS